MGAAKKLYTLTDEHRAQLEPWRDRWIANAMRTAPQTDEDRAAVRAAMRGMYEAASLEVPDDTRGMFVPSPMVGAIAAPIASGVWWLRANPGEHAKLFGRIVTEEELVASIGPACTFAVAHGMAKVAMQPTPRVEVSATDAATSAATDAVFTMAPRMPSTSGVLWLMAVAPRRQTLKVPTRLISMTFL